MSVPLLEEDRFPSGTTDVRSHLVGHVVVLNDVAVVRGGATGIALMSARELARRGVKVTVISGDSVDGADVGSMGIEAVAAGSRHVREGTRLSASLRGIYNMQVRDFVADWIRHNDRPTTVYHLHGWSKILSPLVFQALNSVRSRLVVSAHDFFLACPNGGFFDFRGKKACDLKPLGLGCLVSNCDRRNYVHKLWRLGRQAAMRFLADLDQPGGPILAVHDGMIPYLEKGAISPGRLVGFRNPVTPWCSERVRAECNDRFLFVGRLEEDKGVRLAAEAASQAGVALDIVGDGPLAARLLADFPSVRLHGWKDREGVAAIAKQARAVVVPTRYREAFGLVAVEALGSGLPVVIADHAMIAREITENGMGFACDPHDTERLTQIIQQLATDPELVEGMSRRAWAGARLIAPTTEEWLTRLMAVYSEMLRSQGES